MYKKVDGDLEDVDNAMERLKKKYPEIYNEYNTARVIKVTGIRHRKPPTPPDQSKPPDDPTKK